jgi:hypothetical protein
VKQFQMQGMWGAGDCIHQRAVLRELMKAHDVHLQTPSVAPFHDLIGQGLKISRLPRLKPRIRETTIVQEAPLPRNASVIQMTYGKPQIDRHGSILAAQFACAGLKMPERPDFSLPVPEAWRSAARILIATWPLRGKPLLIYRPIVLNTTWCCPARSPDPDAYAALFAEISEKFFVVSLANLAEGQEWIVGPEQEVDVRLHRDELDFETMAGLYAEASIVFANPGNATIFAQAVGTPSITIFGGHESFRTTNSAGAHLAPTLAIEPINPCECHARTHDCDKRIDVEAAKAKVREFACRFAS